MELFSRSVELVAIPRGTPRVEDFRIVQTPVPPLGPDQILVRNAFMSLDPSMRIRMRGEDSDYLAPYVVGGVLDGFSVGTVVQSTSARIPVDSLVRHHAGWRDIAVVDAEGDSWRQPQVIEPTGIRRAQEYLGPLGPSGLTAWAGLLKVAELRPDDVVFVSAAAGAVGSMVVQIASILGNRVIGSAGSADKVDYVRSIGADAAFSYRDGDILGQLRRCAPNGIDVYFDNVGGEQMAAALELINARGRIALCGMVAGYGDEVMGQLPGNLFSAIAKGITLRGFLARMYAECLPEFTDQVSGWLDDGSLTYRYSIAEGLDSAPQAFIDMLTGRTAGKALVALP